MSRMVRKQIFSIVDLLEKANKILEKEILKKQINQQAISELLMDCQNSAITIGNQIESLYGEGTESVQELEAYCENLYQMSISLGDTVSCRTLLGVLTKQVKRIRKNIGNDVPNKLEILFLPYNASMWDSLESVWKAAQEDEDCDAYVVPIPYFDKNPDGTFGKMFYEGDKLPDYVPIVSWEKYNIEERHPDIIYIHNPYDAGNFVTSVHPTYYASKIKDYTENLVYIPYFLFVNDVVNENMVLTNGVLYSDYVIIQSEACCEKCIQIYDNFLRVNGYTKLFKPGKEKFLPLGSPIVDKVTMEACGEEIPEEWSRLIGNGEMRKKVILYNTHISDVMGPNAERFFQKIESVFKYFKKHEEIVLLWRPHPLTRQTIQSMNPGAAQQYQRIVDSYKQEGWGIYDDTSELNRSVAISDAYYGDWSSLVTMFQEAGKPILLQNLDMLNEIE